jgi:hypothetical protein
VSHPHYHSESSARKFGGRPEDYIALHNWFDATKECFADFRHRALRHHAQGIFEAERTFGVCLPNGTPVRLVGELHVRQDCGGRIPSVADWLGQIYPQSWMNKGYRE